MIPLDNLSYFIKSPFLLFFLFIFLIGWNIILQINLLRLKKRLKTFFNGSRASDLEGVLFEEIRRLKKVEKDIKKLFQSSHFLEKIAARSIQKVGLIRFNPFKEKGGDQSFVIALLDSTNNGLVISSLYTPNGVRVYSKPIKNGQSPYPLTQEEIKALKEAGCIIK